MIWYAQETDFFSCSISFTNGMFFFFSLNFNGSFCKLAKYTILPNVLGHHSKSQIQGFWSLPKNKAPRHADLSNNMVGTKNHRAGQNSQSLRPPNFVAFRLAQEQCIESWNSFPWSSCWIQAVLYQVQWKVADTMM